MSKREQRALALAARRALSPEERAEKSAAICRILEELGLTGPVLSYMAMPEEPDLSEFEARPYVDESAHGISPEVSDLMERYNVSEDENDEDSNVSGELNEEQYEKEYAEAFKKTENRFLNFRTDFLKTRLNL